jgi:hypothetical protein
MLCAYLDSPPTIGCPWLVNESLVANPIVLVQMVGIPNKMGGQKWVGEEIQGPIPQRPHVHIKFEVVLLVTNGNNMMFKLQVGIIRYLVNQYIEKTLEHQYS